MSSLLEKFGLARWQGAGEGFNFYAWALGAVDRLSKPLHRSSCYRTAGQKKRHKLLGCAVFVD